MVFFPDFSTTFLVLEDDAFESVGYISAINKNVELYT